MLRMATRFNNTSHHEAISCYKNINSYFPNVQFTEVIGVWIEISDMYIVQIE